MPETTALDAIGLQHGTDKSSLLHDYLNFYELFFAPLRNAHLTILEIGVLKGASLKTWEEYFVNAKIVGADISPSTKQFEKDRVSIELLDQSNIEELTRAAIKHGPFDIIIEDGSHIWEHQITSLRTLFPFLKNGGIYIVEDLQTNYGDLAKKYQGVASSSCVEYLKSWVDLRVGDDQVPIAKVEDAFLRTYGRAVRFITFYRRACLIKKEMGPALAEGAGYPLVARDPGERLVALCIIAHVSNRGDIRGPSGFVNLGSDRTTFQGITIESAGGLLEYRVRWRDAGWSEWFWDSTFAGTKGKSKLLTGFTIRIRKDMKDQYVLRAFGRFVGHPEPAEVGDEQDCASPSSAALCAIQVDLAERERGH